MARKDNEKLAEQRDAEAKAAEAGRRAAVNYLNNTNLGKVVEGQENKEPGKVKPVQVKRPQ